MTNDANETEISIDPHTIDGSALVTTTEPTTPQRPVCTRHLCLMVAYKTERTKTYYKCQVPECDCRDSRDRGANAVVPQRPTICPRCQTACEVDKQFRSRYLWQLRCNCGFSVRIPKFVDLPGKLQRNLPQDIMDI